MEVNLTPDQNTFVRQAIDAGRLHRPEEAVREALAMWEERERRRAEILAAVDTAEASLANGKGRVITAESMRQLADEVKARGRARLAAEQQTPGPFETGFGSLTKYGPTPTAEEIDANRAEMYGRFGEDF